MMIHCISWKASMRAEHFLYFNNSRVQGEDLALVKCIYPAPLPPVAQAAVRSKTVVLLLFIYCLMYFPLFVVVLCLYLFCYALLCVYSSSAIILKRKRKFLALLLLPFRCVVTINVLWLFLVVPWVSLQCVIVVFPDHSHFHFGKGHE